MALAQDLAEQLAKDTVAASEQLGDENLPEEIARAVGASSPTTEEFFRTAVRTILAEKRARKLLERKLAAAGMTAKPPEA
ncbi:MULTISPECIES: hypothetical protein [Roseicyclus]|jgi:hypothetical protein|uniref:hypothetical protein n=1 Tax=Roseicyclus amphidinii TaxID=3034232 RepID=UPI0024E06E09|nr:hypothetical protein [Roseicyclus sp. Amp-Y-6]